MLWSICSSKIMKNNQKNHKIGRGGYRPNSGRPKGSTNKISPQILLHDFRREQGMTFSQFINKKIKDAEINNDHELVSKYILGLAKYIIQDIQQVDHTTQGQSLRPIYNFPKNELPDWSPIYTLENDKKD